MSVGSPPPTKTAEWVAAECRKIDQSDWSHMGGMQQGLTQTMVTLLARALTDVVCERHDGLLGRAGRQDAHCG